MLALHSAPEHLFDPTLLTWLDPALLTLMRIALAAVGLLLAVLVIRRAHLYRRTTEGYLFAAFAGFGIIATVDQLERIGGPGSWRLPAYAIVLTLALVWVGQTTTRRRDRR